MILLNLKNVINLKYFINNPIKEFDGWGLNILILIISLCFTNCNKKSNNDLIYAYLKQENCDNFFSKKIKIQNSEVCYLDFDSSDEAKRDLSLLNEFNPNNIELNDEKKIYKEIDLIFDTNEKKVIKFNLYYSKKEIEKIEKTVEYIFIKYAKYINKNSLNKYKNIFENLTEEQKIEIIENNDILIMISPIHETKVPLNSPPNY